MSSPDSPRVPVPLSLLENLQKTLELANHGAAAAAMALQDHPNEESRKLCPDLAHVTHVTAIGAVILERYIGPTRERIAKEAAQAALAKAASR